jgi:hypothetical protein
VTRYAATPLTAAFSPDHSDITIFRPWSPIATGEKIIWTAQNEKLPTVAHTTGTVDDFGLRSDISETKGGGGETTNRSTGMATIGRRKRGRTKLIWAEEIRGMMAE